MNTTSTTILHPFFGPVRLVKAPTPAIPATMTTSPSVYFLGPTQYSLFVKTQNAQRKYVADVKRHLDNKSIKEATGLSSLVGVMNVIVDDEPARDFPHRMMRYNDSYQQTWGNQPLYGNMFVVLSKNAWNNLPESKKLSDEQVQALTLQPTV